MTLNLHDKSLRINRDVRFYLGGVWVLYLNLAVAAMGVALNGVSLSGSNGALIFFAALLAIPISWFGVALMILALAVFSKVAKLHLGFKQQALVGGWSAVAYAVLSVGWMFGLQAPFLMGNWLVVAFNPVTLGLVLLVVHVVLMRKVKVLLGA